MYLLHKNRFTRWAPLMDADGGASGGTGEGDDNQDNNGGTGDSNEGKSGEESKKEPKTFTQEEVDKMISSRLGKAQKAWEKKLADEKTEADKLAAMQEDEKKKYQEEKRLKELEAREAAVTKRELTAQAIAILNEKGLPVGLSDFIDYKDADSVNESIDKLAKVYQTSVESKVEDKIKGGAAMKKAPEGQKLTMDDVKGMSTSEINARWDDVQEVLKANKK